MKTTDTACIVHAGLRCRMCAVVIAIGVALAAAPWSQALAQGSEPRLLMPPGAGSPSAGPDPSTPIAPPAPAATNPPAFQAGNPAAARLEIRMTQLEQDLRAVTGRLEEVSYQLRKLDERLSKVTSDMEYRFSQIKTGAATEPSKESLPGGASSGNLAGSGGGAPSVPRAADQSSAPNEASSRGAAPPAAGSPPSQTASLPPKTPREQYARAFSLLEKRNYEEAGAVFSEFLKANPTDPLADNARYWLGETYYARGEYGRSAEIFLEGYEKNKTGPKAPDTLLKLGLSLAALDKKKEACASFRELNRAFPNAPESVKEKAGQESKRLGCS